MHYRSLNEQTVLTFAALRRRHPGTSFPREWAGGEIDGISYAVIESTPAPDYDPLTEIVSEAAPEQVGGGWRQAWVVSGRALEEVREELHARRKAQRTAEEVAGFTYREHRVDSDRDSILRITQAAAVAMQALQAGGEHAVAWTCADGSELPLDAPGVIGLQQALAAHGAACHARSQALKAEIEAAETLTGLAAIDIEAGWPAVGE